MFMKHIYEEKKEKFKTQIENEKKKKTTENV